MKRYCFAALTVFPKKMLQFLGSEWQYQNLLNVLRDTFLKVGDSLD
jgi:hypothetical protein